MKIPIFIAVLVLAVFSFAGAVVADDLTSGQQIYELAEDDSATIMSMDGDSSIPSKYNLCDYNLVTPVRNQGNYSTCWSFGTMGAIESAILKKGIVSTEDCDTLDLSELQLVYFFGVRDGVTKDVALPGFEELLDSYYVGGIQCALYCGVLNTWAVNQLRTGIGIATETLDELKYSENVDDICCGKKLLPTLAVSENAYYIKNGELLNVRDTDQIKTYLMEKGAATVSYYADYYWPRCIGSIDTEGNVNPVHLTNLENDFQNCTTSITHTVTLVGWDDDYDRGNFANIALTADGTYINIPQPERNGAWLVKNSWGSGTYTDVDGSTKNYDGYFWISYEDTGFGKYGIQFYDIVPANEFYDTIYQYDGGCDSEYLTNEIEYNPGDIETISARNVFVIKGSENSNYEKITAVSFVTGNPNVSYEIKILVNDECKAVMSGTETFEGYYTVDLPNPVYVKKGDTVDVQIEFSKYASGTEKLGVCTDASGELYSSDTRITYSFRTTTDIPGRSFVKYDRSSTWVDISGISEKHISTEDGIKDIKYGSARIKLYTKEYLPETPSSSSVTSFFGTKDGSDFTFDRAVVITKATLPGVSRATVTNTSGNGWYTGTLTTDGLIGNGVLYFQVPLDVIDLKGYTVNDISLNGGATTYLSSDNQYAYYSAVLTTDGSITIDFEKDAANTVSVAKGDVMADDPVKDVVSAVETIVSSSPAKTVTSPVSAEKPVTETPAKSPIPVLGILAGLGVAAVFFRRY